MRGQIQRATRPVGEHITFMARLRAVGGRVRRATKAYSGVGRAEQTDEKQGEEKHREGVAVAV
jgi:hypothetical protein